MFDGARDDRSRSLRRQHRMACDEAECLYGAISACTCHHRGEHWWPADLRCDACRCRCSALESAWEDAQHLEAELRRVGVMCREEGCLEPAVEGWCAIHQQARCEVCGEQLEELELTEGVCNTCVHEAAGW
jgi:hypothetical protein